MIVTHMLWCLIRDDIGAFSHRTTVACGVESPKEKKCEGRAQSGLYVELR